MKIFGMIALLSVVTACGGGGSSSKEGSTLDPLTQDKFEENIMSLRPGMVKTKTTSGTELSFSSNEDGEFSMEVADAASTTKTTILNISGDDIYVLEETTSEGGEFNQRDVRKDSLKRMIRETSEPLPKGWSMSISGDRLTVNGSVSDTWEMDSMTKITQSVKVNFSLNLNNIRCSERSTVVASGSMKKNGRTSKLPNTRSTEVTNCGRTLSETELRAIDLSSVSLCDESTGSDEVECSEQQDLSHLVQ